MRHEKRVHDRQKESISPHVAVVHEGKSDAPAIRLREGSFSARDKSGQNHSTEGEKKGERAPSQQGTPPFGVRGFR